MTKTFHPSDLSEETLLLKIRSAVIGTKGITEAQRRIEAIFSPRPFKLQVGENPHSKEFPVVVTVQAHKNARELSLVCAR